MPTTLTNGIQLPDKGSVDWYNSMQSNYNLIDTHLGDTDTHVTAEDKANWDSKQGSLSQAQLDAIAQVATNTDDIATLQSGKANASHTHSSSDITDIDDYATKQYVDNSISGLVDSAPNALDTLNELAAALNDDANFATTVTNALSAKANSADLATIATSGSYNDLSNKPTINDSTITIQKNGSTVDTFTTNGSAKTINITVPTKTSDLTNDSNFVVSSNSAVASGITSAKVTDYDTHIADTDIHVTTADKTKWNNQTYVFRYSSTALVASSTNSNTLLDNTDNLKVGDKVIDSNGVLFSITAIDTANSTFSIGTALIDLAQDSDVVHKSGNETVGGQKTFSENITCFSKSDAKSIICKTPLSTYDSTNTVGDNTKIRFSDKNNNSISYIMQRKLTNGSTDISLNVSNTDSNNQPIEATLTFVLDSANEPRLSPGIDNTVSIGRPTFRYKSFYGMNYYYGANNVEFSTKFVTTDTAQTISGNKTFSSNVNVYNSDSATDIAQLVLKNQKAEKGGSTSESQIIYFTDNLTRALATIRSFVGINGQSILGLRADNTDSNNNFVYTGFYINSYKDGTKNILPITNGDTNFGTSTSKWKSFNGLEPSSLSLPSGNVSDIIDISSYITDLSGNINNYTAPANGWISITMNNCSGIQTYIAGFWGHQVIRPSAGDVRFLMPVLKNLTASIFIFGGTIDNARFIPCQGNV